MNLNFYLPNNKYISIGFVLMLIGFFTLPVLIGLIIMPIGIGLFVFGIHKYFFDRGKSNYHLYKKIKSKL